MSQETELYRLEQIVEKLLVKYEDLKAENGRLNTELTEKKAELASLETALEGADMVVGGADLMEALQRCYRGVDRIQIRGSHHRRDIGAAARDGLISIPR